MSRVSTYLNFNRQTEQAFAFYRSVFGGDFSGGIHRFGEVPAAPGQPAMAEADRNLVMHIELVILDGHVLMGTDAPESMGFTLTAGNNVHINLEPDTRAEAERLFHGLSAGGQVDMALQDMFWGAYFGSLTDRFGVHWMVNCASKN
jgi:PhnB protein